MRLAGVGAAQISVSRVVIGSAVRRPQAEAGSVGLGAEGEGAEDQADGRPHHDLQVSRFFLSTCFFFPNPFTFSPVSLLAMP